MKHGKNPTREQKIFLRKHLLKPHLWLIVKDQTDPPVMIICHRITREVKSIDKEEKV